MLLNLGDTGPRSQLERRHAAMTTIKKDTFFWQWAVEGNGGESAGWHEAAEELIQIWSNKTLDSDTTIHDFFWDYQEIDWATALLFDGLLPEPARQALALLWIRAMDEMHRRDISLETFLSSPHSKKRGRRSSPQRQDYLSEVDRLTEKGLTKTAGYEAVALQFNRSVETVRSEYERANRKKAKEKLIFTIGLRFDELKDGGTEASDAVDIAASESAVDRDQASECLREYFAIRRAQHEQWLIESSGGNTKLLSPLPSE